MHLSVCLSVCLSVKDPEREKPVRAELKDEVLKTATQLRSLNGFSLVVLDTENKFVSTGMAKVKRG